MADKAGVSLDIQGIAGCNTQVSTEQVDQAGNSEWTDCKITRLITLWL